MHSQTEQWWQRGGFKLLHFLQYLTLGFDVSGGDTDCELRIGLPKSGTVNGIVSAFSSSTTGLQFGGTLPGSVKTTEK